jgi:hypothetical protein
MPHLLEHRRLGQRTGHYLDCGNVFDRVERVGHEKAGRTPKASTKVCGREPGGAAADDCSQSCGPFDLLQQALPVKEIARRGIDDPVGIGDGVE